VNKQLTAEEFVGLVGQYRDEFFRYILRTAWDSGTAEDIFSAAMLAGYENRGKFTPGTNFRAWMYRIITNKCYVANRETGRTFQPLDDYGPDVAVADDESGYHDVLEEPEFFLEQCGDEVHSAIRKLSQAERSCIMLRAVERFSYKEIAETLEMPVGTVMTHLSRGRSKLRKELAEYGREQGILKGSSSAKERGDEGAAAL
jgi:RNA polymerase sigma-70 factor (ECF subfamily)